MIGYRIAPTIPPIANPDRRKVWSIPAIFVLLAVSDIIVRTESTNVDTIADPMKNKAKTKIIPIFPIGFTKNGTRAIPVKTKKRLTKKGFLIFLVLSNCLPIIILLSSNKITVPKNNEISDGFQPLNRNSEFKNELTATIPIETPICAKEARNISANESPVRGCS